MTTTQIESLFNEVIQEKALYHKLEGISRNTVFNWLNERSKPTIGDMLNVLHQLKKINITNNDLSVKEININTKDFIAIQNSSYERAEQQIKNAFSEEGGYVHKFTFDPNKK